MVSCSLVDETQEEHWWNFVLRRSDVDDDGASCDSFNKSYSLCELKWQQNLDLPMQCEQSTVS